MLERSRQEVVAPDGRTWTVGIRWFPRPARWLGWGFRARRQRREGDGGWADLGHLADAGADSPGALLAVVAFVILFLAVWFFVFPVLVLALDIVLVLFLALVGVAARVLFRRPWTVEAATRDEQREWQVVGWGSSRATVAVVARALQKGQPLPPSRFTVP